MLALSAIGIVFGSFMCLVQQDIKKVIAYSSVAHLGFVMLGIFSFTVEGAQGGVRQMVNHGHLDRCLGSSSSAWCTSAPTSAGQGLRRPRDGDAKYAVIFMIITLASIGLRASTGSSASSWCCSARSSARRCGR